MDITYLNSNHVIDDFNCMSFVMHCYDNWKGLDNFISYYTMNTKEAKSMIEDCVQEIVDRYGWTIINDPKDVDDSVEVVGFRVSFCDEDCNSLNYDPTEPCDDEFCQCDEFPFVFVLRDFHFILRKDGKWYHKVGREPIESFNGDIYEPWEARYLPPYTSEITWFVKE